MKRYLTPVGSRHSDNGHRDSNHHRLFSILTLHQALSSYLRNFLLLKNANYFSIVIRYSDIFVRFVKSMFNNQNSDIKYP